MSCSEMQHHVWANGGLCQPNFYSDNHMYQYYGEGAWEKPSYTVTPSFSVARGDFCFPVDDK